MDKDSTKNKIKGNVNQAVGATREKAGDLTGNEELEAKGAAQHAKGDAQEAVGNVQGAVHSATEKLKDAVGQ